MHEALECPTAELRTKCAQCRKLGPWARECPEGNQGERNDERFNRRAWRSEDNSKGFIAVAGHTARRPFLLGASWTFVALDPGEVLWGFWRREGACWGTATETVVQITGRTWPPGRVELGETGIHKRHRRHDEANRSCGGAGRVRRMQLFTVVEQDVPPLLPVGIMRTLQESLDLDDSGEKGDLPPMWRRVPVACTGNGKLCENDDKGFATNYLSAISHLHKRPRCRNDCTPTGDHDVASTRSCRPRPKTAPDGDEIARSRPTNVLTSPSRFKRDEQMNSNFQNREQPPGRDSTTRNVRSNRGDVSHTT